MGCSLFANYHFQMGVTVKGFAEDFGLKYNFSSPFSKGSFDFWCFAPYLKLPYQGNTKL